MISQPFMGEKRFPGLAMMAGLIVLGLGIPAIFRWKVVRLGEARQRILEEAPSEPEARLARWFAHGQPRILEGLKMMRFSSDRPWIVSHVADPPPGQGEGEGEIWGIDVADLSPEVVLLDGLVVRVILPAPTVQGRGPLVGDNAQGVEHHGPGAAVDPRLLAANRIAFVLRRLIEALPKDIPGARISIEVGGLVAGETGG